jgi:hypothetical protein
MTMRVSRTSPGSSPHTGVQKKQIAEHWQQVGFAAVQVIMLEGRQVLGMCKWLDGAAKRYTLPDLHSCTMLLLPPNMMSA